MPDARTMFGLSTPSSDYHTDRQWSDSLLPQVERILKENALHIVSVNIASDHDDQKRATDFVVEVSSGRVAVRSRRSNTHYRHLTIRAFRKGSVKTEWHKIREGWGDWYLYTWVNYEGIVSEYILVDLNTCRSMELFHLADPREHNNYQSNPRGNTGFVWFDISVLNSKGALVAHRKIANGETISLAGQMSFSENLKNDPNAALKQRVVSRYGDDHMLFNRE